MATCNELKAKYIDHLMHVDLDTLDMCDLNTFAYIIKTLNETERADYFDRMLNMMPWSANACATTAASNEEVKDDG